jgi:hypothetical protein
MKNTLGSKRVKAWIVAASFAGCLSVGATYLLHERALVREFEQLALIDPSLFETEEASAARVQALEARVARDPEGAIALAELARAYLALGIERRDGALIERAEQKAQASLAIAQFRNVGALEVLARAASHRHDFERAIELSDQLIRIGAPQGYEVMTSALLAQGNVQRAREIAQESLQAEYGLTSLLSLGLVEEARGAYADAEKHYKAVLAAPHLTSRTATLWSRSIVARFFLRRGRLREASIILRHVLAIDDSYPFAVGLQGEISLARSDARAAASQFQRAFQLARDPFYLCRAAEAFKRLGDERSRREHLTAAQAIYSSAATSAHPASGGKLHSAPAQLGTNNKEEGGGPDDPCPAP